LEKKEGFQNTPKKDTGGKEKCSPGKGAKKKRLKQKLIVGDEKERDCKGLKEEQEYPDVGELGGGKKKGWGCVEGAGLRPSNGEQAPRGKKKCKLTNLSKNKNKISGLETRESKAECCPQKRLETPKVETTRIN